MCIRDSIGRPKGQYKGNDGAPMRAIQTVEIARSDTVAQDNDTQSSKDPSEKKKNRKFPKNLETGASRGEAP